MSLTINTNIKNDTESGYLADAKNIKAAHQTVKSFSDLNTLPKGVLVNGSHAYVSDDATMYIYTDGIWDQEYSSYSAGAGIVFIADEETSTIQISCDIATADDYLW